MNGLARQDPVSQEEKSQPWEECVCGVWACGFVGGWAWGQGLK